MNVLYDIFYEVLSEEGVWVLVLIASAFAVASFILLTLRMETSPKQGGITGVESKPRKEKRARAEKKKQEKETEETSTEKAPDLPESPEMTPPGSFTQPEIVLPGSAPYKNIPQPLGADAPGETGETAQSAPAPLFDPFDLTSLPSEETSLPDTELPPTSGGMESVHMAGAGAGGTGGSVGSIGMGQMPEGEELIVPQKSAAGQLSEDDDSTEDTEKAQGDDIFNLFEEAEAEQESELAEVAKELEDVAVAGLLTETEGLTQELKELFTRQGRRD